MKQKLLTLLLLIACVGNAWGINYYVNTTARTAEVVSSSDSYSYDDKQSYSGTVVIPQEIVYNGATYLVTSIGRWAFQNCSTLTSVTIPNSVTSIGTNAFRGCSSLASITIPNSVTSIGSGAFYQCTALASIAIPESVTNIEYEAFEYCSSLTSVTIPSSVTSIGSSAFWGCSSLTSITIPESVTSIGSGAFSECTALASIAIPESVRNIGGSAFYGCSSLISITIPESVTSIGNHAFWNTGWYNNQPDGVVYAGLVAYNYKGDMPANTSIVLKDGTKGIADIAFYGCSGLASITIPESVTSIGYDAFYNTPWYNNQPEGIVYAGLVAYAYKGAMPANTSIVLKDGTKGIADVAFQGCSSLTSVTIPESVTSIGRSVFEGCSSLTSLTIPESVRNIGGFAFYRCSSLTSITIPASVTSIGSDVFSECSSLASVTVSEGIKSIGAGNFIGCTSLTSITIPNSVTSIGNYAFQGCSSLTDISCLASEPPTCGNIPFYTYGTLHVLPGCGDAYRAAGVWKYFTIVEDAVKDPDPDTDIDALENVVYLEKKELMVGTEDVLTVMMKNAEENITGFQFDLYLPEGINIAEDEYGEPDITLSGNRTTLARHSVSCQVQEDGAMRVACTSLKNYLLSGNDGEVLQIKVNVSEDMEAGDYPLIMKKVEMTTPQLVQYKNTLVQTTFTVDDYMLGDVNNDHDVTVADVAGVVNFILNTNTEGLNRKAADINKDDEITVADAAGTVNILLGVAPASSPLRVQAKGSAAMNILPFMLQRGEQIEVPVVLNGYASSMTGLQFDLALPAGLRLVEVLSDKRHQTAFAEQADQRVRIVAISNRNATFTSASEAITLVLEAEGSLQDGQLEISGIEMVRPDMSVSKQAGFTTSFSLSEATGIQTLEQSVHTKIYDLQGRQVRQAQGGIYIVDGKKKVIK